MLTSYQRQPLQRKLGIVRTTAVNNEQTYCLKSHQTFNRCYRYRLLLFIAKDNTLRLQLSQFLKRFD